jgi:hypothetical protein
MARQQLTEAVGIPQPLNRIAGALGRPGDDLRVEGPCWRVFFLGSSCPSRCGQPRWGVPMARQQLTEAVGIPQPLNRIAGALGRPGEDVRVEPVIDFYR